MRGTRSRVLAAAMDVRGASGRLLVHSSGTSSGESRWRSVIRSGRCPDSPAGVDLHGATDEVEAMSTIPQDGSAARGGLVAYRSLRRELEDAVLPLAGSLDGRRFMFQASVHDHQVMLGGY